MHKYSTRHNPEYNHGVTGFKVGPVEIENRLLLAPMEDVSNLPFRRIIKEIAKPGLMFTEFVSAMAIHYGAKKTFKKLKIHPDERPLSIQIFGGEVETMVETAKFCEDSGCDILDINMGCWVPKVCKTGAGAALLKDPDLAEEIVKRVVKAVSIPVTVKVRAGWDYSLFAAPELARRFQDAGIQMLTLHARFAKQGMDGEADWKLIGDLREQVTIPLIGNGDVKTPEDAIKMMADTGCDGVMVGRAAISNPWALARIRAGMMGEPIPPIPNYEERMTVAMRHLRLMVAYELGLDEWEEALAVPEREFVEAQTRAVRHLRGQIPMYIKGEVGASQIRNQLTSCDTVEQMEKILHDFGQTLLVAQ
jgi:nifR3 family TIM-barrel protein